MNNHDCEEESKITYFIRHLITQAPDGPINPRPNIKKEKPKIEITNSYLNKVESRRKHTTEIENNGRKDRRLKQGMVA